MHKQSDPELTPAQREALFIATPVAFIGWTAFLIWLFHY